MKRITLILLALPVLFHCTMLPKSLQNPEGEDGAILGISIRTITPVKIFTSRPATVYFVRLEEGDTIENGNRLIHSNYRRGEYAYAVGVKPGRYAAVAVSYMKSEMEYHTFFDAGVIEKTVVDVAPRSLVFAGKLRVNEHQKSVYLNIEKHGDRAQVHYYNKLKTAMMGVFFCGSMNSYANDPGETTRFKAASVKYFAKTGWKEMIEKSIDPDGGNDPKKEEPPSD